MIQDGAFFTNPIENFLGVPGLIRVISQTLGDRMKDKHLREEWQCNARN